MLNLDLASFINRLVSFAEVDAPPPALLRDADVDPTDRAVSSTDRDAPGEGIDAVVLLLLPSVAVDAPRDFLDVLPTDAVPFADGDCGAAAPPLFFFPRKNLERKALDLDMLDVIDAESSMDSSETESDAASSFWP